LDRRCLGIPRCPRPPSGPASRSRVAAGDRPVVPAKRALGARAMFQTHDDSGSGFTISAGSCDGPSEHYFICIGSAEFVEWLSAMLRRYGPNADEILSETLLRLCSPAVTARFRSERGSPAQFAAGIARRVAAEMARKRRPVSLGGGVSDGCPTPGHDPCHEMIVQERHDRVRAALDRCSAVDLQLIGRKFGVGLSSGSRRAMTGSERSRLSRLLRRLAAELREI
jgi:DNA-directed RNA polymerase specialized sigma24 family protein